MGTLGRNGYAYENCADLQKGKNSNLLSIIFKDFTTPELFTVTSKGWKYGVRIMKNANFY